MNTKMLFPFILIVLVAINACGQTNNSMDERQEIVDQMDPNVDQNPGNQELNDKLGYVRYKKDQLKTESDNIVPMDRTKMANAITRIILNKDGFEEVATLVTDQEVLIVYDINEDIDTTIAEDIAKKSAMSVMPRYFNIHVSDNKVLINDIHSLHNSRTQNKNYDKTIDRIINEMEKSTQGKNG